MNPDEQKTHKKATDALDARLGHVETVADRFETVEGVVEGLGTWLARWSTGVVAQLEAAEARAAAADALLATHESRIVALTTAQATIARLEAAIGDERTQRLRLADEQRTYVDGADRDLRQYIDRGDTPNDELRGRPLRGRLRWLVVGR